MSKKSAWDELQDAINDAHIFGTGSFTITQENAEEIMAEVTKRYQCTLVNATDQSAPEYNLARATIEAGQPFPRGPLMIDDK